MNLTTKLTQSRGFTIVELLIVVVVIAILAAITIVSYNGITQQANTSSAQAAASNVLKKAEAYINDSSTSGGYPATLAALTATSAQSSAYGLPASAVTLVTTALSSTNPSPNGPTEAKQLNYRVCGHNGTSTAPATIAAMTVRTGVIVTYWNFSTSTAVNVNGGNVTTGGNPNIACIYAVS